MKIVTNGLWGDRAKEPTSGMGLFEQIVLATRDVSRPLTVHTGIEGMRAFEEAVRQVSLESVGINPDRQVDSRVYGPIVTGTGGEIDAIDQTVVGYTSETDLNFIRLQRGDITAIEYLDLLSRES